MWTVMFHDEFDPEFEALAIEVQNELYSELGYVELRGPETRRPHVDTLSGSKYPNMKELRFEAADGEWRVAFAFDPIRRAICLVAGDKTGISQKKFYERLIAKADRRYTAHLAKMKLDQEKEAAEATAKGAIPKGITSRKRRIL